MSHTQMITPRRVIKIFTVIRSIGVELSEDRLIFLFCSVFCAQSLEWF